MFFLFVKVGTEYLISLLVEGTSGERIFNDTPYTIIKDIENSVYYNGVAWSEQESQIELQHVGNGLYTHSFVPDSERTLYIVSRSDTHSAIRSEEIRTYSADILQFTWQNGEPFVVSFVSPGDTAPEVTILKESDKMYYLKMTDSWTEEKVTNPMSIVVEGSETYTFSFSPPSTDNYTITISESGVEKQLFSVATSEEATFISPVTVSSEIIRSQDGSDSTVLSESGSPIAGTFVSAYKTNTDGSKELVAKTTSDTSGKWTMVLRPGEYYFMFEKEGYKSIGMQRRVV